MFYKISAKRYRLIFFITISIIILISMIFFGIGFAFLDTTDEWIIATIFLVLSAVCIILFIVTLIFGVKRLYSIPNELMLLSIQEYLKEPKPLENIYFNIYQETTSDKSTHLLIDEIGLDFDGYVVTWEEIDEIEIFKFHQFWYFKVKKAEADSFLDSHLILAFEHVEIIMTHFYNKEFNKDTYMEEVKAYDQAAEKRSIFGLNTSLRVEKLIYIVSALTIALTLGITIELKYEGIGVISGIILVMILMVFIYPKRYNGVPIKRYMIDTLGIGYAEGKKYFYVLWSDVLEIEHMDNNFRMIVLFQGQETEIFIKYHLKITEYIKHLNETKIEKIIYIERN